MADEKFHTSLCRNTTPRFTCHFPLLLLTLQNLVLAFESAPVGWEGLMDKWETAGGNLMDEPAKIAVLMSWVVRCFRSGP